MFIYSYCQTCEVMVQIQYGNVHLRFVLWITREHEIPCLHVISVLHYANEVNLQHYMHPNLHWGNYQMGTWEHRWTIMYALSATHLILTCLRDPEYSWPYVPPPLPPMKPRPNTLLEHVSDSQILDTPKAMCYNPPLIFPSSGSPELVTLYLPDKPPVLQDQPPIIFPSAIPSDLISKQPLPMNPLFVEDLPSHPDTSHPMST